MVRPRPKRRAEAASARRCAIYTRKSSEEGLEQAFNSLDAQREACEAYARSQRDEGWILLPARYDDGGLSGGTLNRPALQQLLADTRAGKLDLVLVYKVDRLTRSLADFAKIVEVLDSHGASFVSVTQQFNTATSMGRLTLNMLLSFAQFEREVAGERIRDKIAASKRKGLWMGGTVPLGYDVCDRKLVINTAEAENVRHIFRTYVEFRSVRLLKDRLAIAGVTSKAGRPLGRGPLFHMLQNRTYRGEIAHKGAVHRGEHAAIIAPELWEAVQRSLAANRHDRTTGARASSPSLLAGLLFDHRGEPMTATHAVKGAKRYRYYISRRLITETREASPHAQRIPAGDLEGLIVDRLRRWLTDPQQLFTMLRRAAALPAGAADQHRLLRNAEQLAQRWSTLGASEQRGTLQLVLSRIEVHHDRLEAHLSAPELRRLLLGDSPAARASGAPPGAPPLVLSIPATLRRSGQEMALVIEGPLPAAEPNPALIKLIAKAHAIRDALGDTSVQGVAAYAEREGLSKSYVARVVRLAYLAPRIITAILDGRQPPTLTATRLMQDTRLPLAWAEQERVLGFA